MARGGPHTHTHTVSGDDSTVDGQGRRLESCQNRQSTDKQVSLLGNGAIRRAGMGFSEKHAAQTEENSRARQADDTDFSGLAAESGFQTAA